MNEFLNRLQVNQLEAGTRILIRWQNPKVTQEEEHVIRVFLGERYVGPVNLSTFVPFPEIRLAPPS